jgi:hypothetical protein
MSNLSNMFAVTPGSFASALSAAHSVSNQSYPFGTVSPKRILARSVRMVTLSRPWSAKR